MDDCVVYFPEDIVKEILLRCPVKSLLRFKCVCKNWYTLIKTPEFVQQHLKILRSPQLLAYAIDTGSINLISQENPQTFIGMTKLIGHVDGLFLMYGKNNTAVSCALWNPATREVRPLHVPLPAPIIHEAHVFGFGLNPLTNDYKVVYFHLHYWREYAAAVYSYSRDSWRVFKPKEPVPFNTMVKHTFGTAYLNGAYYWLVKRRCCASDYTVVLFDFGSEMFKEIEGPDRRSVYTFVLGLMLIDDSIAILSYNPCSMLCFDIWVMVEPGVWNKLVTFECFTRIKSCYDGSLILASKASQLVSYNVRTKKMTELEFHHSGVTKGPLYGGCGVFYYKESLVTIKQREAGDLDH